MGFKVRSILIISLKVILQGRYTAHLIFRHDLSAGLWTLSDGVAVNQDDPNAAKYSRLDELESFRSRRDDRFHFRLCYPAGEYEFPLRPKIGTAILDSLAERNMTTTTFLN